MMVELALVVMGVMMGRAGGTAVLLWGGGTTVDRPGRRRGSLTLDQEEGAPVRVEEGRDVLEDLVAEGLHFKLVADVLHLGTFQNIFNIGIG
jgi:hypothetical protein